MLSIILQLYGGGQIYWWMKPKNHDRGMEKTTDLSQTTDKLSLLFTCIRGDRVVQLV